jgi:type II secretory ATPase GspE/PulE/Tfp pilus assembly ATPase PilB-like protein
LARSILEKAPFLSGEGAADIRQANGCAECDLTGYLGRLTVAEVMVVDASIQEAIMKRKDAVEIARVARARGMRTMHDDGLLKIWRGLTTLEELIGVTDGAAAIEITA